MEANKQSERKSKLRALDRFINGRDVSASMKKTLQQVKRMVANDPTVNLLGCAVELGDVDVVKLLIKHNRDDAAEWLNDASEDAIHRCMKLALKECSRAVLRFLVGNDSGRFKARDLMWVATKYDLFWNLRFFQFNPDFDFGLKPADEALTKIFTPDEAAGWMFKHYDTYKSGKIRLDCTLGELARTYGVKVLNYVYVRFPTMEFNDVNLRAIIDDNNQEAVKWFIEHSEQYLATSMEQILNAHHYYTAVNPYLQPNADEDIDAEQYFTSSKLYSDGYVECAKKLGDPDRALKLFCEFRDKQYVEAIKFETSRNISSEMRGLLEAELERWKSGERSLGYRREFRTFREEGDGGGPCDEFYHCIGPA